LICGSTTWDGGFSWPFAWLAVRLGIPAIGVTYISVAFVWAGAALIALGNPLWQIIGALCFQMWLILDCADGSVARATNSGSLRGEYADAFGGYSVSMLLYTSMGIAAARTVLGLDVVLPALSGAIPALASVPVPVSQVLVAGGVLLAGAGASLFSLYARLSYQKFQIVHMNSSDAATARPIRPRDDRANPVMVLAQNVAANSGFPLPLAIVALALGWEPMYAVGYLIVNAAMLLLTVKRTFARKRPPASAEPGSDAE
jgi:hypothetical protein